MDRLQITVEDIEQYAARLEPILARDWGHAYRRELRFNVGAGEYRVYENADRVGVATSLADAVAMFNAVPQRA